MSRQFAFPYLAVHFDKNGRTTSDVSALPTTSDVLLISHGWNNDDHEAQTLYNELLGNIEKLRGNELPDGRALSVIGIFWPSKRFRFADHGKDARGPAAGTGSNNPAGEGQVQEALSNLRKAFQDEGTDKQVMVDEIVRLTANRHDEDASDNGTELVNKLRQLLSDTEPSRFDWSREFMSAGDASSVFKKAADVPSLAKPQAATDGPAAGIRDVLGGIDNGFENLLNLTSYYKMKARAGMVGKEGVAPLIDVIATAGPVKYIHLVGHSFGARLVTAAAMTSTTGKLYSMSLLQAAFSHHGFGEVDQTGKYPPGYFRSVIEQRRVRGPILVTYSEHDRAVGKAYAIASRMSGDTSADLGGKTDLYGGMGANGALRVGDAFLNPAMSSLGAANSPYSFVAGRVHNIRSDIYISDHSDVRNPEVAWAVGQAIASAN